MANSNQYPAFSVLMSVYKKENANFLNKALASVEHQTVIPAEIILVEDGPLTEELYRIIKKHRKIFPNRFLIVQLKKNQGLGNALRIGTGHVTTEWIARMDSDDICADDRFEKQLTAIIHHNQLSLVGGQVKEFSGSISNIVGKRQVPLAYDSIVEFLKWRSPFNHPTVMINKNSLLQVGGYKPYGNLEDYYLWVRLIVAGFKVMNLPNDLVYMRVDQGMYARRGRLSNLKYVYRLRKYMQKHNLVNYGERIWGNILMTANMIAPVNVREFVYRKVLHH